MVFELFTLGQIQHRLEVEQRNSFIEELNNYLDYLLHKQGLNIIWGDFNINRDQPGNRILYKDFNDLMESYNFKQIVNEATHERNGVLDLIFLPSDFY